MIFRIDGLGFYYLFLLIYYFYYYICISWQWKGPKTQSTYHKLIIFIDFIGFIVFLELSWLNNEFMGREHKIKNSQYSRLKGNYR